MTFDVTTRFPRTTSREAYERSKKSEKWVFQDLVCSSVTTLYGRSSVGKSYLVSSMVLSLLLEDREFLGVQPVDAHKLWKPAILWTDPGSDTEYGERFHDNTPEGVDVDVPLYYIGRTTKADEWDQLVNLLIEEGHNFVVVDNLMGTTGDTNDSGTVTTVFDGLTKLTNWGVPVVVLHHESEHGRPTAGAAPMGASVIVQKSRVWIQVRQTAKRKFRGGNTALIVRANGLDQPQQIVAEPLHGPDYRVLSHGPWDTQEESEEKPKKQERSKETYDANQDIGEFLKTLPGDPSERDAARQVTAKFGGSEHSHRRKLTAYRSAAK